MVCSFLCCGRVSQAQLSHFERWSLGTAGDERAPQRRSAFAGLLDISTRMAQWLSAARAHQGPSSATAPACHLVVTALAPALLREELQDWQTTCEAAARRCRLSAPQPLHRVPGPWEKSVNKIRGSANRPDHP